MRQGGRSSDDSVHRTDKILLAAALRSANLVADLLIQMVLPQGQDASAAAAAGQNENVLADQLKHRDLAARAEFLYRQRRKRDAVFGGSLFGEPAFDILLDLYVARIRQSAISVSSCCIAAAVPATTALRWIALLEGRGLLTRSNDPLDARRSHVSLSDLGAELMERFLVEGG